MATRHVNKTDTYMFINLTTLDYNVQVSLYNNSAHRLYITQHTVFRNSTTSLFK